ncbi:DUF5813 family protein [Halobacteriaceae archaeon GCM10025711]
MTAAEQSYVRHADFERDGDAYVATATQFDATVTVDEDAHHVRVTVPMLDAVVVGETVAPVVEEGWYETFELRLEDVSGVLRTDDVSEPTVTRDGDAAVVEATFEADGRAAAEEAMALVNYVEGTWFEGVIPGYEYVEEIQAMRERAHQNAGDPTSP